MLQLISVTMREVNNASVASNISLPAVPFPSLVIRDSNGKRFHVVMVEYLMKNFTEDDLKERDPFGNMISVLVAPLSS